MAGFDTGYNTNPEFTGDGQTLFFIGTPDGIANVYRTSLSGGSPVQVTNVLSGVQRHHAADARPDRVRQGRHAGVHGRSRTTATTCTRPNMRAGHRRAAPVGPRTAAILPSLERTPSEVAQYLATPTDGLPVKDATFVEEEYSPKLSLDDVVQPSVGIGVDRFGAFAGGGMGSPSATCSATINWARAFP